MDGRFTEPRDLRPHVEADAPLRGHHESGHEDSATKSSRVYFFVIAAIIALAIAVFLILHPQAGD